VNTLAGKTLFITGSSRGIGKAIGLRAAQDGANVVIVSKTETPHPKLPGTIHTAAEEIEARGGKALAVACDIRFEEQVQNAVDKAVEKFGKIDVLVNNASAISITPTEKTTMKRYDLMHGVNVRGTFLCTQKCLPHLEKAENPHILNLAPPLNMKAKWFANHCAYTMTKYGMSMCVLGMHEEFRKLGIAVNALWPKTVINTAALNMIDPELAKNSRKPEIMGDAAAFILYRDSKACTGNFFIDEDVLREEDVGDLDKYLSYPDSVPREDYFLD